MSSRPIVRDPDKLSGRWHFEGTTIPIATLVADYQYGRDEELEQYRFMQLTSEEIDAALAFDFPTVRDATIQVQYAALVLGCECGEDMQTTAAWPNVEFVDCLCGRRWHIPLQLERVSERTRPEAAQ